MSNRETPTARFERLEAEVREAQAQADRAAGAHAQHMVTLKQEFGVDALPQAEKLLRKLEAEARAAEETFTEAMDAFEEEFGDALSSE